MDNAIGYGIDKNLKSLIKSYLIDLQTFYSSILVLRGTPSGYINYTFNGVAFNATVCNGYKSIYNVNPSDYNGDLLIYVNLVSDPASPRIVSGNCIYQDVTQR